MWGPEVEQAITAMWENIDGLLERGGVRVYKGPAVGEAR